MQPETKARDQSPNKEGMDQPARETEGVLNVKEVDAEVVSGSEEEASAPPLLAHPCSLLQLLLSACTGCLGLRGYCSDDDPKPAAVDDDLSPAADDDDDPKRVADKDDGVDAAAPAVAETPQEGAGGGGDDDDEAASYLYLQEMGTRVRRRTPTPPGAPGEGQGGGGGQHN